MCGAGAVWAGSSGELVLCGGSVVSGVVGAFFTLCVLGRCGYGWIVSPLATAWWSIASGIHMACVINCGSDAT